MFCGKLKEAYKAATQRITEAGLEIASLRTELAKVGSERDALRAEAAAEKISIEVAREIYTSLQNFGVTFTELQQSQVAAANSLRDEKNNAVEAASVSVNNRESVMKIANSLESHWVKFPAACGEWFDMDRI